MTITYTESLDGVTPAMLDGGFWAGWPDPPSPETHLRILRGSYAVELARDEATSRVVGFVTAISDGVHAAYIPYLEVLEEYKGGGIGSELVRRILTRLEFCYMIDLLCDEDVQPFYERLGMRRATGMLVRNYDCQSGEKGGR